MHIHSTRFGLLEVCSHDLLDFPAGLLGLESCRKFALLADALNDALGWLQSASRPEVALAVVSPRRFVPHYQFRVARGELAPLALQRVEDAQVLAIVGKSDGLITLNLQAPVVLNLARRLGRQVVANGELPLRHVLGPAAVVLKKTA